MMLKDKIKEEKFKEWTLKWSNKKFKNTMFLTMTGTSHQVPLRHPPLQPFPIALPTH